MRDIKFRAWDDLEKKWLFGYEYPNLGGFSMYGETMLFEEWSSILNRFILQQKDRKPEHLKLMQFTGIQDKNGKDIYEGDILKGHRPSDEWLREKNWIGKVKWASVRCAFVLEIGSEKHHTYTDIMSCTPDRQVDSSTGIDYTHEIIGNIYETPAILTPKTNTN